MSSGLCRSPMKSITIVLRCTHYPLLLDKSGAYLPPSISVVLQGPLVTDRLDDYDSITGMESRCSKGGCRYRRRNRTPKVFRGSDPVFE